MWFDEASLGEASLGEASLGEASLGEASLGEASLGEASLGDERCLQKQQLLRVEVGLRGVLSCLAACAPAPWIVLRLGA